ncbi:hypothetical protein HUJ04_000070 [Dendroctonus ponderosae]|nr:hypothetical protein HUJ04_000070 [Dendroctonus ponderosae]
MATTVMMQLAPASTIKFNVAHTLFTDAIRTLGTGRHAHFLQLAEEGVISGCYCLTEIAHGSNVKAMRTSAVFDKDKQCFVLNSEGFEAAKCWAGGLGQVATHAIVYAQLRSKQQLHGLHCFVVPIRDPRTLLPFPGLLVGDMGEKIGLNGIDNGFVLFQNYEIPKENLLNKLGDVTEQGDYVTPFKDPSKRHGAALGALSGGRVVITGICAAYGVKALTIAVRYAAVRQQFGPSEQGPEVPILEYQTHQYRLLPHLACAYLLRTFAMWLSETFFQFSVDSALGHNKERLPELGAELHAISSASKPLAGWSMRDAIQECREACGGHGYLKGTHSHSLLFTGYSADNRVQKRDALMLNVADFVRFSDRRHVAEPGQLRNVDGAALHPGKGLVRVLEAGAPQGRHQHTVAAVFDAELHQALADVGGGRQVEQDLGEGAFGRPLAAAAQRLVRCHCHLQRRHNQLRLDEAALQLAAHQQSPQLPGVAHVFVQLHLEAGLGPRVQPQFEPHRLRLVEHLKRTRGATFLVFPLVTKEVAGLGDIRNDHDANMTYEGENHVLIQQTSNWLLKFWPLVERQQPIATPLRSADFMSRGLEILRGARIKARTVAELCEPDAIIPIYQWLVCHLLQTTHDKLAAEGAKGAFWGRNNCQVFRAKSLGVAFIQHFVLQVMLEKIEQQSDAEIRAVLRQLFSLQALFWLEKLHMATIYEGGLAQGGATATLIQDAVLELCAQLKDQAVALVDAVAPPDFVLNSPLGASDGQVYKHLQAALLSAPFALSRPAWWQDIATWKSKL